MILVCPPVADRLKNKNSTEVRLLCLAPSGLGEQAGPIWLQQGVTQIEPLDSLLRNQITGLWGKPGSRCTVGDQKTTPLLLSHPLSWAARVARVSRAYNGKEMVVNSFS